VSLSVEAACCGGNCAEVTLKRKSRGFLLCPFSGSYPPPGTLPNLIFSYCSGVTDVVQVVVVSDVALERTTASAKEQKYLVPVWLGVIGDATT
jgi:hypothetical protein